VDRPALLHFDGWDGNVLCARDDHGAPRMTGLVDGERHLYGDPLMDLVSPLLFRRIENEPRHPFLLGYAGARRPPLVLDEAVRRRLTLYRRHLYLLRTVEMPSRNITREARPDRYARLAILLDEQLTELARNPISATG
jgi:aminoglycoside phosphotransferase (APT) family kinase protein